MCLAKVVFCRNQHCFEVLGWHIIHPCQPAALAGCRAGDCVFDHTQRDWASLSNGCRQPRAQDRVRSEILCCEGCLGKAMDVTMECAKEGVGNGLLGRRLQQAKQQRRDLFGKVELSPRGEPATVRGGTPDSSGSHNTPDEKLDSQSTFVEEAGVSTKLLSADPAVKSEREDAEAQEHAPAASYAYGPSDHAQLSLPRTATPALDPKARASDDPESPSYYLYAEDIPPHLLTKAQPTQEVDQHPQRAYPDIF